MPASCLAALLLLSLLQVAVGSRPQQLDSLSPSGDLWRQRLLQTVQLMQRSPALRRELQRHEAKYSDRGNAGASAGDQPLSLGCQLQRSSASPTSVHRLRPGDVDIIAAVGDSLTAANGALATSVVGIITEYRGYAWNMGGQVGLREHTTLANILRHDNRRLYGYSTGSGSVSSRQARFNGAVPGAVSEDMLDQVKNLVRRMQADRNVDYRNDWKIINLFIGGNDICNSCKEKPRFTPAKYVANIRRALDYLHANVPRAFVNVAEVLDVSLVKELKDAGAVCGILHGVLMCRCGSFPETEAEEREIKSLVRQYQRELRRLVDSGRYDTRDDFTVVNQPFLRDTKPPRVGGKYDQSFFSPDCFHFSQKGHAAAAKGLWNNMLQSVGRKSTDWGLNSPLSCPTFFRPYLMTSKNS